MTELRFDGQVAIVTGAGRGLGRAHALLLAERGACVVVNDVGSSVTGGGTDGSAAESVAAEIREQGGQAIANVDSVATADGGAAIVAAAVDTWGRVDVVVNNAGTVDDALFDDMTGQRVEPLIDVHLKGAFFVTRPAWKVMRERGYGRVVNTTSAAGILGSPRMSNYGSAKTGLIGFTRVLAAEGTELGIKVNAVAPIANTRMLERSMASVAELADPAALASAQALMQPFFEKIDPALVAPVVAFLAHADCPVTGELYTAGAGQVSRFFIGRTKGFHHPALSLEDVAANLDVIRDETGYTVPSGPADEMAELFAAIMPG
ncbi:MULTISPECIES: SDR family NAD(P)-dependent oxidoreductase [unclassified Mycobacterium]|uniref:SDR family NAD(P)-dependent oxidoreductase n=1 Tax=unclassified Mycobacterium TaxID=2642494 RepID=UPI0029C7A179|nr:MULTISPECIES: SDR family NAD(P)-dependent oxidoreductase [unclassified Mycobacterium]